jgi:hypothetical protein
VVTRLISPPRASTGSGSGNSCRQNRSRFGSLPVEIPRAPAGSAAAAAGSSASSRAAKARCEPRETVSGAVSARVSLSQTQSAAVQPRRGVACQLRVETCVSGSVALSLLMYLKVLFQIPLIHFIPDSLHVTLTYSAPLFLKRQICDRGSTCVSTWAV